MHVRAERFLSRPMAVAFARYGLFALTFSAFQVKGDALVYFNLLRRFFGEEPDFAYAYQFGSALWNAPFFLVGKAFGIVFGFQPRIFHVSFEEISITVATNVAFVLTLYLGWRILRELDLPRGPGVLFLTAFGTPLFFYIVFDPAGKHAVDTLLLTAATYVFLRCDSRNATRAALVLGALCGWSLNIRWANGAFFLVLAIALLLRERRRLVGFATVSALIVASVIFALPATRGIEYFFPIISQPVNAAAERVAAPPGGIVLEVTPLDTSDPGFDPTIPARMLFSLHRGLFLWTPLTALAVIGFVLALRRARQTGANYPFLLTLLAAALALLCIHVIWPRWDGGFSFSQRFLTALFPLYLIGVAELVRRARLVVYPILVATVAFALMGAFVHDVGYDGVSERDGIGRILEVANSNRDNLRRKVQTDAEDRWKYLWGLLEGRDSKCINEP
ncbi:MAG: glycosyltransferase family 39 protein, partial [Actinobacteria bacterium]|nr:glycosyltransferase family 39 protein [Actinomycetota bacterium]